MRERRGRDATIRASCVLASILALGAGCQQSSGDDSFDVLEGDHDANYECAFGEERPPTLSILNSVVIDYGFDWLEPDDWEFEVIADREWIDCTIESVHLKRAEGSGVGMYWVESRLEHPLRPWYAAKDLAGFDLYYMYVTSYPYVHMLVEREPQPDARHRVLISKH